MLYLPGDAPAKLVRALGRGADGLLVDLADAVLREDSTGVRDQVADWLRTVPAHAEVWVRVNPGPVGHDDARVLVGSGLRGLVMARTDSITQLDALDHVLSTVEAENGLAHGSVAVAPTVESAAGLLAAPAVARGARVVRMILGEYALRAELRVEASVDERELMFARSQLVVAGAAAGLASPVGPISIEMGDTVALRSSSMALRRLGYGGRVCLHPSQVDVVNEVFS